MKILYVNSPVYDFLTATIIEGLNNLAEQRPIQLVTTRLANYAKLSQLCSRREIYAQRRSFDLYILGTNMDVDIELFWDVARYGRSICIDGEDTEAFSHSPEQFNLYFKRELLTPATGNIRPCPFAIEHRWLQPVSNVTHHFLAVCFGPSTEERACTLKEIKNLQLPDTILGPIAMKKWMSLLGVVWGQCTFVTWKKNQFAVGHNYKYYRILHSSLLGLSMSGVGCDTGRYWEILGSGALLLAPANNLQIPSGLVPNEHFIEYRSLDELIERLRWARLEQKAVNEMRHRARQHCLAHHTTKERARYVLDQFDFTRA